MSLSYRNRAFLLEKYPEIAEAFDDLTSQVQNTMTQTNSSPSGIQTPAPPAPSALTVTAANGIFDAKIDDNNSPVNRGINYFLEYSKSPAFTAPHTIDLGASRNHRTFLGNQTLYWRAHSSYPTSPRSEAAYHGTLTQPRAVIGGGTASGPDLLSSSGSGTSQGASGSDGGFGNQPFRGTRPTS